MKKIWENPGIRLKKSGEKTGTSSRVLLETKEESDYNFELRHEVKIDSVSGWLKRLKQIWQSLTIETKSSMAHYCNAAASYFCLSWHLSLSLIRNRPITICLLLRVDCNCYIIPED